MFKKGLAILLIFTCFIIMAGCGKKDTAVNENIKQLIQGYQQTMVTFFELKNLQEDALLSVEISDLMIRLEESHIKLEQISGLIDNIKDQKTKDELSKLVEINQEREKLLIKYLNDIRRDLDYQQKNPEIIVDINGYITRIPNNLMEMEYQSEQSGQRLEDLISSK